MGDEVDTAILTPAPAAWTPVVLQDDAGQASIHSLRFDSSWSVLDLDELGLSTSLSQPDTEITSAPPAESTSTSASFGFRANQDLVSFVCALDGVPLPACPSPTLTGLAGGVHSLTVAARDRWGLVDATPAEHRWRTPPDRDRDAVPDAADNCPGQANSDQADADKDDVGNVCDELPPGNLPPVAGRNVVTRLLSGEVFVKLPSMAAASDFRMPIAAIQESGFVPLKGVASLPVGSVVDARKGRLRLSSAANTRPVGDRRRRLQAARFAAGIFRIRQARARTRSSRRIPTDVVLLSTSRAESRCATSTRSNPLKGVVRTLSSSGKGLFRAVGGASTGTGLNATWITSDRCDGTLTEVGRGRVSLAQSGRPRRVTVRAGRAYLARARLFTAKKGRRPQP